jgi:hypothetical protein
LSTQYDVHVNQIAQWRAELIGRATEIVATAAEMKEAAGPDVGSLRPSLWADHFRPTISFNAALSNIASASNRLSLPFSDSSVLNRCASDTVKPSNLVF